MSDKPRLKDPDMILSSLGRNARPTDPSTALSLTDTASSSAGGDSAPRNRRSRPQRRTEAAQEAAPEPVDTHPLDMSKYDLTAPGAVEKAMEAAAEK
jgi:hypothetical protein